MAEATFEKAMKLAVVTGLRLDARAGAGGRGGEPPRARTWRVAALGEMIADKLPLVPSRDTLLPLLVRGLAGAWVARTVQDEDGVEDPWIVPLGAAVAMGVAVAAPKVRKTLTATTGVSDTVLGIIEDYLALRLGSDAVGLTMEELAEIGRTSVEDLKQRIQPVLESVGQSVGTGSM